MENASTSSNVSVNVLVSKKVLGSLWCCATIISKIRKKKKEVISFRASFILISLRRFTRAFCNLAGDGGLEEVYRRKYVMHTIVIFQNKIDLSLYLFKWLFGELVFGEELFWGRILIFGVRQRHIFDKHCCSEHIIHISVKSDQEKSYRTKQ